MFPMGPGRTGGPSPRGDDVNASYAPEPVLRALTWPAILAANFLAAAVMAGYFWLRHPTMQMRP